MRSAWLIPSILVLALVACAREEPEEAADAALEEPLIVVADSVIEAELRDRFDSDPRLDGDETVVTVRSEEQDVTLTGSVPTRREWSFVRELTQSTPGVRSVVDSIVIESDADYEGGTGTPDTTRARS